MLLEETAKLLLKNKKTVAVTESCTGGLICHALTNRSGSSKYFKLGLILYSDEAKLNLLKIKKQDLSRFGPVSKRVAILMAKKIKLLAQTHIGISTTGIAGPMGGSKKNPVGTVYIGVAYKKLAFAKRFRFKGTRTQIKNNAKDKVLQLVKQCLENL